MLTINISTPDKVILNIRDNFKNRRLESKLTQEGLARRSGVSLGSLKRFESSGLISLESLLKLALILDCLEEFATVCTKKNTQISSIDQLIKNTPNSPIPKKGSIK